MFIMMTLEQTVEIPADHRLFIDVPQEIPAGKATLRLEWNKPPVKPKKDLAEEAIEALCGLYAGVDTLDAYMERRHAENRYEAELEEHTCTILRCCP
ncbi:hypothetical protein FACS1894137_07130 [Spirochaetia bacterium]|nr:hypothetical protein FACS1894137_07130 [Spirochaetia bacterium]